MASIKGPIIDTNPVFDSVFVSADAPDNMALTTWVDGKISSSEPGDSYSVYWIM